GPLSRPTSRARRLGPTSPKRPGPHRPAAPRRPRQARSSKAVLMNPCPCPPPVGWRVEQKRVSSEPVRAVCQRTTTARTRQRHGRQQDQERVSVAERRDRKSVVEGQ